MNEAISKYQARNKRLIIHFSQISDELEDVSGYFLRKFDTDDESEEKDDEPNDVRTKQEMLVPRRGENDGNKLKMIKNMYCHYKVDRMENYAHLIVLSKSNSSVAGNTCSVQVISMICRLSYPRIGENMRGEAAKMVKEIGMLKNDM